MLKFSHLFLSNWLKCWPFIAVTIVYPQLSLSLDAINKECICFDVLLSHTKYNCDDAWFGPRMAAQLKLQ